MSPRGRLFGGAILALGALALWKPAAAQAPSCDSQYEQLLALYRAAPESFEYSSLLAEYEAVCIPGMAAASAYAPYYPPSYMPYYYAPYYSYAPPDYFYGGLGFGVPFGAGIGFGYGFHHHGYFHHFGGFRGRFNRGGFHHFGGLHGHHGGHFHGRHR